MSEAVIAEKPRSGIPKTMGVLLIIFASIYLLSSLFSSAAAFLGGSFMDALPGLKGAIPKLEESGINLEKILAQLKPMYLMQGGEKLATAAISCFGLFAGIKLVQYSPAGLRLAMWWAISALGYLVLEIMIFFIFLQPMITKFFKTITDQVGPLLGKDRAALDILMGIAGNSGAASVIGGALFMAIFPILMISLMSTTAARKACGVDKIFD
jgi:hypothetical protein